MSFEEDAKIVDQIQEVRSKNNVGWMDLVRLSLKVAPLQTKQILKSIYENDTAVAQLLKKLT